MQRLYLVVTAYLPTFCDAGCVRQRDALVDLHGIAAARTQQDQPARGSQQLNSSGMSEELRITVESECEESCCLCSSGELE